MKRLKKFNENLNNDLVVEIKIPSSAIKRMSQLGISEDKMKECYEQYVLESLGIVFGAEGEYFNTWTEESDNVTDYQ